MSAALDYDPDDIPFPNLDEFVVEGGQPVKDIFTEKQQRLLTEPLYSSWAGPGDGRPYLVLANVALFYAVSRPRLVPNVMLSVDVQLQGDLFLPENRSYFVWMFGRAPAVVIEIVSGPEGTRPPARPEDYTWVAVPYCVIFDPQERLGDSILRGYGLSGLTYEPAEVDWIPLIGLGLKLWQGVYEGHQAQWLRWCDRDGQVIPTGAERADQERQHRERLEAQLRALGIEPNP